MRLGLNPATVTRLRLVVAPFAAGALALATDCDAATLAGLHLDHVATDGATAQAGIIPPRAAATPTWQGTAPTFTPASTAARRSSICAWDQHVEVYVSTRAAVGDQLVGGHAASYRRRVKPATPRLMSPRPHDR